MDYKKIVLFAGTSEGHELSDMLCKKGIYHTVCVATDYGSMMLSDSIYRTVHEGRMDSAEMAEMIEKATKLVVDATHPYATIVTGNIRNVCDMNDIQYLRVVRSGQASGEDIKGCRMFDSTFECMNALKQSAGNILFTTGSKEIADICKNLEMDRVYARVLPSVKSIQLCNEAGVRSDHIIAMHGPFSTQMNEAVIRQYDIKILVTKDGGKAGGFYEKIDAVRSTGIDCYVIKRPVYEEGTDVKEACDYIVKCYGEDTSESEYICRNKSKEINVSLVACGPGCESMMSQCAVECIKKADVVFGAKRLTDNVNCNNKYPYYRAEEIIPEIEDGKYKNIAVLFSGDTGFFSGAGKFADNIKTWAKDNDICLNMDIVPGISSVAYFASRIGIAYQDAGLYSVHGRNDADNIVKTVKSIKESKISFCLVSGGEDIVRLATALKKENSDMKVIVGRNLSYGDETIEYLSLNEAAGYECKKGVLIVCFINNAWAPKRLIPYFEDKDFIREKIPMTKAVIRHESIRRLNLCEEDVVYDIGSGTGSISAEIATLSPTIKVYAFEKNQDAVKLTRDNMMKLNLANVTVIEGEAPDTFGDIPLPDKIFIGGSGNRIGDILNCIRNMNKSVRVVINAVSLETITFAGKLADCDDVYDLNISQISNTDVRQVGEHQLLSADNPVMVISFNLGR